MRVTPTNLLLAATVLLPVIAGAQGTPAPAVRPKPAQLPVDSMDRARRYTIWLYTTQADSVVAHMDSASRTQPDAKGNIEDTVAELAMSAGSELKVLEEKFITRNGRRQYWRKATFSNVSEPFLVRLVMNAKGEFMGIGMGPASQAPPIDP